MQRGEVHALVGENGAGKSTLVKILAGLLEPDEGDIRFDGQSGIFRSPAEALRRGVSIIHQELLPFPDMTVAENICMGREPVRWAGWLDRAAMLREASALLARIGMPIPPQRKMRELSIAGMQTVEIAKALGYSSRLIIMDEPTSALSDREVEALMRVIVDLRRGGVSVIYVSHRMNEVFRLSDSVTVLRDGCSIATHRIRDVDEKTLIREMVGREIGAVFPDVPLEAGEPLLEVRGLRRTGRFGDVTFQVRAGEILGIAGLIGAGRTDVAAAIAGLTPADSGEIRVLGKRVRIDSPAGAIAHGIALVSEDRKTFGVVPEMSVAGNITLASLRRFCRGPFIQSAKEGAIADEEVRRFSIRVTTSRQKIKNLSGGNQQKAVIARALLTDPAVLIMDEPTRGIDVGAKAEVYAIIAGLARAGKAIIMVSSEMPEILSLSHRILVMREGRVHAELRPQETTAEEILQLAMPQ